MSSLLLLLPMACADHTMEPAEYPEIRLQAKSFELALKDSRKRVETATMPPHSMYKNESASTPRGLPGGFLPKAKQRLTALANKQGMPLKIKVLVERADATFLNDYRGDFTRFDVELKFDVKTPSDVTLLKGTGASWQEIPSSDASLEEQARVFEFTALDAFDRYFADERTLNKLNLQVAAYLKAHPEDAH